MTYSSQWPFPAPEPLWHRKQAKRWDQLVKQGWRFSTPDRMLAHVGIRMRLGTTEAILYVDRMQDLQGIHTHLLRMAEAISRAT